MFEIEVFGLSAEKAEAIVRGVSAGQYSLLLGAGFSMGSRNSSGDIPSTSRLIAKIERDFGLVPEDAASPRTLPLAYEDAHAKTNDEALAKLFRKLFTGCSPDWQRAVSGQSWRRVWTLNIDDMPEKIWGRADHIHFSEMYRPLESADKPQIIYLHGRAAVSRPFVFSISEYRDRIQAPGPWHTVFFSDFNEHPFIACGASLVGEPDLASAIRLKNRSGISRSQPSVAVIKGLSDAGAERIRTILGMEPVRASGKDFFDALAKDVITFKRLHPNLVSISVDANTANAFARQFRAVNQDAIGQPARTHDFYEGDQPLLADLQQGLDAPLSYSVLASQHLTSGIGEGVVPVVGVFGGPGCGKSTTVLRVLLDASRHWPTYHFRNEEAFSAKTAIACCAGRSVVLGFDEAADFGAEIRSFMDQARSQGLKVGLVVSDRSSREKGMRVDFLNAGLLRIDHSVLSQADALAVIKRRRKAKRLGVYTGQSDAQIRSEFSARHHGDLMSSLSSMELGASGFQRRITEISSKIEGAPSLRELLLVVSLVHRWGYALPLQFAAAASSVSTQAIRESVTDDGALADVLVAEARGIRFRHRVIAERYFSDYKDKAGRGESSLRLIAAVAPLVNRSAIGSKTYEFRLSRVLMNRRNVVEVVGSKAGALKWYEQVEDWFGWNSRYWEQRALLEAENGRFAAAYSFAKEAVEKERHPFPLTTLGAVCFMHCREMIRTGNVEVAWKLYEEAVEALDQAKALGIDRPETVFKPVATFLDNSMSLCGSFLSDDMRRRRIISDFSRWMKNEVEVNFCGDDEEARKEIKGFYLRLAVSNSS